MVDAREETELALNVSIQHVLDRTGLKHSQVCTHHCGAAWSLCVSIIQHVWISCLNVSASTSCVAGPVSKQLPGTQSASGVFW